MIKAGSQEAQNEPFSIAYIETECKWCIVQCNSQCVRVHDSAESNHMGMSLSIHRTRYI